MKRTRAVVEPPLLLTVAEVAHRLRLSRSTVYVLISRGQLRSVKQGAARRVPAAALLEYVRGLKP